jgi:hypothetical protein
MMACHTVFVRYPPRRSGGARVACNRILRVELSAVIVSPALGKLQDVIDGIYAKTKQFHRRLQLGRHGRFIQNKTARFKSGPFSTGGVAVSVLATGDFQQVVAELSLDRALDHVDRGAEHDGIEFFDHLAWAERPQVAALTAGRAAGVGFCNFGKISAAFDLGLEFVTFGFVGNKDVAGSGFSHLKLLL